MRFQNPFSPDETGKCTNLTPFGKRLFQFLQEQRTLDILPDGQWHDDASLIIAMSISQWSGGLVIPVAWITPDELYPIWNTIRDKGYDIDEEFDLDGDIATEHDITDDDVIVEHYACAYRPEGSLVRYYLDSRGMSIDKDFLDRRAFEHPGHVGFFHPDAMRLIESSAQGVRSGLEVRALGNEATVSGLAARMLEVFGPFTSKIFVIDDMALIADDEALTTPSATFLKKAKAEKAANTQAV